MGTTPASHWFLGQYRNFSHVLLSSHAKAQLVDEQTIINFNSFQLNRTIQHSWCNQISTEGLLFLGLRPPLITENSSPRISWQFADGSWQNCWMNEKFKTSKKILGFSRVKCLVINDGQGPKTRTPLCEDLWENSCPGGSSVVLKKGIGFAMLFPKFRAFSEFGV